jgi:hypothetical protein
VCSGRACGRASAYADAEPTAQAVSRRESAPKPRFQISIGGCEKEKARESLDKAKGMIEEMGYHRRDGEVAELERVL